MATSTMNTHGDCAYKESIERTCFECLEIDVFSSKSVVR